ncbi:MAG: M15 family metallopeptidase, partial [Candidatus Pacebacteria bacterium]|nr:M15 family metallopeptidase [Candidatus Paceibacterota bacterium]
LENAIKNGNKNASIAIAKAGYSEHQLGTTIDLSGSSIGYASTLTKFGGTPEDLWLNENAHKYGFVQSYPIGKEEVTGYMYEPWHYRYLGVEIATKIKKSGLTITEFLK